MGNVEPLANHTTEPVLEKILHAAEIEFSDKGFDGAGMKALAARAGVSQSLLHYHFGSKDNLYAAVIRERSKLINDDRRDRLRAVDFASDRALEQVFDALFLPALGPLGGGRAYARIFAGLIAGNARDQALVREHYDPTAKEFIRAIERALPGIQTTDAAHAYQFALGVLASAIARDGRAERLAGADDSPASGPAEDAALAAQLTCFVVGGAKALAT